MSYLDFLEAEQEKKKANMSKQRTLFAEQLKKMLYEAERPDLFPMHKWHGRLKGDFGQLSKLASNLEWSIEEGEALKQNPEESQRKEIVTPAICGSKEEGFNITCPFPGRRARTARSVLAQHRYAELRKVAETFAREKGYFSPPVKNADIHFTICLGEDMKGVATPDFDNVDLKEVTDALETYILDNDSLEQTRIHILAKRVSGPSRLNVIIKNMQK